MLKKMILVAAMALLTISAQLGTANASPFVNGGFETGDFTGWTVDSINNWAIVLNSGTQLAGNYEAQLGTYGTVGIISQAFDTTVGQDYKVSFWLANDSKDSTNVYQALWNGAAQNITALDPTLASGYTQYQFTATAANTSAVIAFNFLNDPSVFHLDNVDVAPVPEPGTLVLLSAGLFGLCVYGKRRNAK